MKLYMYSPTIHRTYKRAVRFCEDNHARVIRVRDQDEVDWIMAQVRPSGDFWIGNGLDCDTLTISNLTGGWQKSSEFDAYHVICEKQIDCHYPVKQQLENELNQLIAFVEKHKEHGLEADGDVIKKMELIQAKLADLKRKRC